MFSGTLYTNMKLESCAQARETLRICCFSGFSVYAGNTKLFLLRFFAEQTLYGNNCVRHLRGQVIRLSSSCFLTKFCIVSLMSEIMPEEALRSSLIA